jgi:hypothetical protein
MYASRTIAPASSTTDLGVDLWRTRFLISHASQTAKPANGAIAAGPVSDCASQLPLILPSVSCLIRLGATRRGAVVGSGVDGGSEARSPNAAPRVIAQVRRLIERFNGR